MEETKIDWSEQWKYGGDCDKCRRQPFCRKQCHAVKVRKQYQLELIKQHIMDTVLPSNFPRDTRW